MIISNRKGTKNADGQIIRSQQVKQDHMAIMEVHVRDAAGPRTKVA